MKLLLDESLPKRLKRDFSNYEASTVPEQGWGGLTNGELLRISSQSFDVFITADQNVQYQQNLAGYDIAVIVLAAQSNRYDDLKPLVPRVVDSLEKAEAGEVIVVSV